MTVTVFTNGKRINAECEKGERLLDVCARAGVLLCADCGGIGICGKCRVRCAGGLSPADNEEISQLGDEINKGIRLACKARVLSDASVYALQQEASDIEIPSDITVPDGILCVDLGTSNICLAYSENGITRGRSLINPQCIYGSDVISRICASERELSALKASVDSLLSEFKADKRIISGNTVMQYIYCAIDPSPLGRSPYTSDEKFGKWYGNDYMLSCIGAFVGGDVVSGLYYGFEKGIIESGTALYIDIGTNGETVLIHNGQITACAAAAGPCFEGAGIQCGMKASSGAIYSCSVSDGEIKCSSLGNCKVKGICGTGLVSIVSCLLDIGQISKTGLLKDTSYSLCDDGSVYLTRQDVRALQSAKAAIRAGIEILCENAGITPDMIQTVYLAGAFGEKLNTLHAVKIGLIPNVKTVKLGNASLYGACLLSSDDSHFPKIKALAEKIRYIELSDQERFDEIYLSSIAF